MKKKQNSKLGSLGIVFAFLLIVAGSIYVAGINDPSYIPSSSSTQEQTKTYQSKLLKLSIVMPTEFELKDEGIRLLVSNKDGLIIISRNGTQFNSLDDYAKDFDIKHKTQVSDEEDLLINGNQALSRIIKYPGNTMVGDKIYFIYIGDAVYHFSTSSPVLYADLDQIAQSFRYTP